MNKRGTPLLLNMSQEGRISVHPERDNVSVMTARVGGVGMARSRGKARSKSRARTAAQNAPRGIAGNMAELIERFGTEEACELHMIGLRWPDGFECPDCGHRGYARVKGRREFRCTGCGWQFSATSGTLIAHTKLPLTLWFRAAFMVCSDARGASAQAIARECGVSDLTGHRILDRLRAAMGFAMSLCKVGGEWVELDGASVTCGNADGDVRHAGSGKTDAPALLAVSGTRMAARSVSDVTAGSVSEFCAQHVSRNRPVRCDDHPSHRQALPGGWDARMRASEADGDSEASLPVVHHAISNLKAKLVGTCHGVTLGRLQAHLDEFAWKYSHRLGDQMADLLGELARWPHARLPEIRGVCATQPPHDGATDPGYQHNRYVDRKMLGRVRGWLVGELDAVVAAKAAEEALLTHV